MSQMQNEDLNFYITEDSARTNSSGLTNAMSGILRNRLSKRPRRTLKGNGADYMNNDLAEHFSKHRKPITKF